MRSDFEDAVAAIMREAAAEAIMPLFRALEAGDVEQKAPGEVVTRADRDAEAMMTPRLQALIPGSRVIGEEAASEDPGLLRGVDGGDVWLLDPLDGTANFAAGRPDFAVMVGLLREGVAMASWILAPTDGVLAVARRGEGAYVDGRRVRASEAAPTLDRCRGAVLTRFLPAPLADCVRENGRRFGAILPGAGCAGVDYPKVATGAMDFVLFWRLLPWDHVPGTLFLEEAGGHVARLDGSPYRAADQSPGLLAASNRDVWTMVRDALPT